MLSFGGGHFEKAHFEPFQSENSACQPPILMILQSLAQMVLLLNIEDIDMV